MSKHRFVALVVASAIDLQASRHLGRVELFELTPRKRHQRFNFSPALLLRHFSITLKPGFINHDCVS